MPLPRHSKIRIGCPAQAIKAVAGSTFAPTVSSASTQPVVMLNAATKTILSNTFDWRASTATYFDSTGTLQTSASNNLRWDYDTATVRTNQCVNSNTAWAWPSSSGQYPTYHSRDTQLGLDKWVYGSLGQDWHRVYSNAISVPVGYSVKVFGLYDTSGTSGQVRLAVTWSTYTSHVYGTFGNVTTVVNDSVNIGTITSVTDTPYLNSSTIRKVEFTFTSATANWFNFCLGPNSFTVGATIVFIGIQVDPVLTSPSLFVSTKATASSDSDYKGLLVEAASTNYLTYAESTTANWGETGLGTVNGVTVTKTTGTERGMAYREYTMSGTATASGGLDIQAIGTNRVAVTPASTWTSSVYYRVLKGSFSNMVQWGIQNIEEDSSQVFITATAVNMSDTTGKLARVSSTRTYGGTAAYTRHDVIFSWGTGAVINLVVRIYAPQIENAGYASSYIPTNGAQVTRAADTVSNTQISALGYNQSAGTFYTESIKAVNSGTGVWPSVFCLSSTVGYNKTQIYNSGGTNFILKVSATTTLYEGGVGTSPIGSVVKIAFSYSNAGTYSWRFLGSVAISSAISGVPVGMNRLFIGNTDGSNYYNGWIRKIVYYPYAMTTSQISPLTV